MHHCFIKNHPFRASKALRLFRAKSFRCYARVLPPLQLLGACAGLNPENEDTTEDGVIWGMRDVTRLVVSQMFQMNMARHHQTSRNIYGNWGVGLILPRSRRLSFWRLKVEDADRPWWYRITHHDYTHNCHLTIPYVPQSRVGLFIMGWSSINS